MWLFKNYKNSINRINMDLIILKWLDYFGAKSQPCCMSEPMVNQVLLRKLKLFSNSFGLGSHGWGLTHSSGVSLMSSRRNEIYAITILSNVDLLLPGQNEQRQGNADVSGAHVNPDLDGERWHEREQTGRLLLRLLVQNADACRYDWIRCLILEFNLRIWYYRYS
jgi:hypothetical protein